MNVGDVQTFLTSLGALLRAHQGGKPATAFDEFCSGLEPFKELPIGDFVRFLRDADEYKRTGVVPLPQGKKGRGSKAGATPLPKKAKAKTKEDTEAIREAVARLQALYERFADPALTAHEIESEVDRVGNEFDVEGIKAVARSFGITSGLSSKAAVRGKIRDRITERKDRYERSEAFSTGARPPDVKPAPPAPDSTPPDLVVEVVTEATQP